jgi:uncharacterized protein YjaZ
MKFNVVFIKSKNGFNKKERRKIENIIKKTADHAAEILDLEKKKMIIFSVYPFNGKFTFGTASTKEYIQLYVVKRKFDEDDLRSAIYHEMHHVARGFCFFTTKKFSFLETLFSEGLAVVFEIEQIPKRIPIYAKYTNDFIKKWLPQLRKENLWGTDFSHDEWFWGRKGKPYRLGYKIGAYLVNQIKNNHPQFTAEKLVKKNAKTLLKLSRAKL